VDPSPNAQAGRIRAAIEARDQRARDAQAAKVGQARLAGVEAATLSRGQDRDLLTVWSGLTPEVRAMYAARELAERLSKRPEWREQTPGERIAAVTAFITDYPAIKEAKQQQARDKALGEPASEYPAPVSTATLVRVLTAKPDKIGAMKAAGEPVQLAQTISPPLIAELPGAEVPDLFTINRRFNWNAPHGQWMNQMLKDIDAAKAAGDTETYNNLTRRYSAWAEKYLRR
jgi:hypothetical protein